MILTLREAARQQGRIIYLELLVLGLSIYSLLALCADLFFNLSPGLRQLLSHLDTLVCGIFLLEFFVHLWRAPSKWEYLRWGWIDLLSSIPAVGWLRWARVFRVLRILRTLRSYNALAEHFAFDRARSTFGTVTIMSILATLFSTIAVLHFEREAPGANIHTPEDALWWAFATITTIGYGDLYPVSAWGRVVAVLLVICGLSIFGTFTAFVASFFMGKGQKREEIELHHVQAEIKALHHKLDRLETRLHRERTLISNPGGQPPPGESA